MGTALPTRSEPAAVVADPGGFPRHPSTGAPQVTDPTKTRVPTGKKDELLAKCAARGIQVPAKATVADLRALLGPEMAMAWYGRPSSLGKQIENMTNLQKWSERATTLGLFLDPDLFEDLRQLDPDALSLDDAEARKVLDAAVVKAKARAQAGIAAERGTHTHALTEDFDNEADWIERARQGEDLGIPHDAQAALVAAWEQMLARNELEILAVETPVVDDRWRQAGTLDRIARLGKGLNFFLPGGEIVCIPGGTVIVLDVKTGRLRCDQGIVSYWHGYAVQIASYAQSLPYDPATGQRGTWEWEIDQRYALIAHLDVLSALEGNATCRLVLVDLAAGREAGERCVWARQWENRTDVFSLVTDDDDTCVTVEVAPSEVAAPAELEQSAGSAPAPDPALELANEIGTWGGELKKLIAAEWPSGVPTPKRVRDGEATWDAEQLMRVQAAVDEIVGPFDDPPAERPEPAAVAAEPPLEREQHADHDAVATLVAEIKASPARSIVNAWLREADNAGVSWSPRARPTLRHYEIARAAFWLASIISDAPEESTDADFVELVRHLLCEASDAVDVEFQPIGVLLAALTATEAIAVAEAAQSLVERRSVLVYTDQGPSLVAA
jgi:hypothetical protein